MWRDDRFVAFRDYLMAAGCNPSPFDSWLLRRGLKTLELRVRRQSLNAQQVAEFLTAHPKIEAVHYPGLPTDPGHDLAKSQMSGFGGMLAFVVKGGGESARALSNKLELFTIAASLGGVESLVGYPPVMSHAMLTESQRIERGIVPGLLRLSIGIEDAADLIEDLDQALS
jgi:cystathionine beta-lyase/cystathionine gamma-synthase